MIGKYPTPLELVESLSSSSCRFWVKRDDLTATLYGGNKVRKLERILPDVLERKARRIVTFGAAGSHHVLATARFAGQLGIPVAAVLTPQPQTPHAERNLRASLAAGVEAWPAPSFLAVPMILATHLQRSDYLLGPGGTNVRGTLGYLDAAHELAHQWASLDLPPPEVCVVALGSGGTAAGLLAGFVELGWPTRVSAIRIVSPRLAGVRRTVHLAEEALRERRSPSSRRELEGRIEVDGRFLGRGYGHETSEGREAEEVARASGLRVDPTYTAKTFAAALARARSGKVRNLIYWHTLSSARLEVGSGPIPPKLARLLAPEA